MKTRNMKFTALLSLAVCIILAAAMLTVLPVRSSVGASAAGAEYAAFVDIGGNSEAASADGGLGLSAKNAVATVEGNVTTGSTLFTSYAEGATYSFDLAEGEYRVSVAVAEANAGVSAGGSSVDTSAVAGNAVVTKNVTVAAGTPLTVSATGKMCGILVAAADAKILMAADYTAGQVVPYGAVLENVLENAVGHYSDGSTEELKINYYEIPAGAGVNVNFTTVDVKGKVEGTEMNVTRYVTTMPDNLVYFINCGSFEGETDEKKIDTSYALNKTVFDYYEGKLVNNGIPDRVGVSKGGNDWGLYTSATTTAPNQSTFPYNTLTWTETAIDMGYMLTSLTAGEEYRIYIGTLSAWHARTVDITFNGAVVDSKTLRINAYKGFSVYENVPADGSGKIDLHMQGASTNEPCINFIAVQPMSEELPATPADISAAPTIGMEDHTVTFTSGVSAGGKVQIYNAAKPNQIIYEEEVDPAKLSGGRYTIDFGEPLDGISQFYGVQINKKGTSGLVLVSVTDIEDFLAMATPGDYTVGAVTVSVSAHANSGIASWSFQNGEFGEVTRYELDNPFEIDESFTVTENGDYVIIVTSGLGVTYSETLRIYNIDPDRPVINVLPSVSGWSDGAYYLSVNVEGVAPVAEYVLYRNGMEVASASSAPASVKITTEGEYTFYIKNKAGLASMATVFVSGRPTTATVTKTFVNRTLKYAFTDTDEFKVASVTAYSVNSRGVSRVTMASGNSMDVYTAGTYVVSVTTTDGRVEMFSISVTNADLGLDDGGLSKGTALGVGLGLGLGLPVLAAVAVVLFWLLVYRKKSSAKPVTAVETATDEIPEEGSEETHEEEQ